MHPNKSPQLSQLIKLVDTHCHINIMAKKKFDIPLTHTNFEKAAQIAQEASDKSVEYILNVGTSLIECQNCINLAQKNKTMFAAVGIHPCDITTNWHKELKEIIAFLKNKESNKIVAIGECGLDLYHDKTTILQQKELFKAQIELSFEHNLPLNIHTRESTDELVSCLELFTKEFQKNKNQNKLNGVMHCFYEKKDFADYVINLGFVLGIGGPITYPKNEFLREVILDTPLDKIVLETDAPFLPPQQFRGKQNHPKYIKLLAQYLAELKQKSLEEIAQETTSTALKLFNFKQ